jgi:hypothetical protein
VPSLSDKLKAPVFGWVSQPPPTHPYPHNIQEALGARLYTTRLVKPLSLKTYPGGICEQKQLNLSSSLDTGNWAGIV